MMNFGKEKNNSSEEFQKRTLLRYFSKGFTLIELLVVIAVIGLVASIVLVSVQKIRAKAKDARRMQDLEQIKTALILYYEQYGNWIESGSGCGYQGNGMGWFNYVDGTTYYPKPIAQCLIDSGLVAAEIIDPTGGRTSTGSDGYTYMKYHCGTTPNRTVQIFAKLEGLPYTLTATDGTCCEDCDWYYGMNYYLTIQFR